MIYAIAKISVKQNDVASIDRKIILYRGDKNVEIQFEIVERPYRQYKRDANNIIYNLEASYGQLVIVTPDNGCVVSEITETKEGRIVFVIPPEMTDENIDLGFYTFQIRLFDESLNSRVTLPPVYDGIEIQESIFTK